MALTNDFWIIAGVQVLALCIGWLFSKYLGRYALIPAIRKIRGTLRNGRR